VSERRHRQLGEGLHARGYTRAEDGLVWETFLGDDLVVQCPPVGEEELVSRARALLSRARGAGARVPEVVDGDPTPPAYLVVRRIHGRTLSAVRNGDEPGRDLLAAVESAGETLGRIHSTGGEGYGDIEAPAYHEGSSNTWRGFVREVVADALEFTAGGPFAAVVEAAADGFRPAAVPETPPVALLHDDFSESNVIIDPAGRAWAVDLDNALYGDSRFGFVRARSSLAGDESEATAFGRGYGRTHELALGEKLEDEYVRLAIVKSAHDGEWCRRNTTVETADWADGLAEWYRSRFE